MNDLFEPGDLPRIARYDAEQIFQAYMRAKNSGQSSTPFRFTDKQTRYFNVIWDGQAFTRNSFDLVPLDPVQN
jgi:hypothetical protein